MFYERGNSRMTERVAVKTDGNTLTRSDMDWVTGKEPCAKFYAETRFDAWYGPDEDDLDHTPGIMRKEVSDIARKVCRPCPVKLECLTFAFEHNETSGIWGGLTPYDRTRLKTKVRAERAAKAKQREELAS